MIKNWKNFETFTIFDFFRRGQNLSIFYQFFIDFLSVFFIFQGNRGKWIKPIKKWWKMIKIWLKKWKKTRDIHHFWLFPKQPRIYHFFYRFFIIFFIFQDKNLIKKMKKNSRHSPFLIVSEAAQNLSFFYRFFIICFIIFQGNRGKWIKTIKNWWKMIKQW